MQGFFNEQSAYAFVAYNKDRDVSATRAHPKFQTVRVDFTRTLPDVQCCISRNFRPGILPRFLLATYLETPRLQFANDLGMQAGFNGV